MGILTKENMTKKLIKNHNTFLLKNKLTLFIVLTIFLTTFLFQTILVFVDYLFWNFNWLLFFSELISVLLILNLLFSFYFSKSKKNLYDVFLNSNVVSKRKLITSKSLYIAIAIVVPLSIKSTILSLILIYQISNIKFIFSFCFSFLFTNIFVIIFFIIIYTFLYLKYVNKNIFIKLIYSLFFVFIFISLIIKTVFAFYISNNSLINNENKFKVAINNQVYIYEKDNKNNKLKKIEPDIVSAFYSLPTYVFNKYLEKQYLDSRYLDYKNRINLTSFSESNTWVNVNEKDINKCFIYHEESPIFFNKNNDFIINFIKESLIDKIKITNFASFKSKLEETLWNEKNLKQNEIEALEELLGKNNKVVLDFKRDWDVILKLNHNLRIDINEKFKCDLSSLFDLIYSSEISKMNTSYSNLDFYVENDLDKYVYDETMPINEYDWLFLRNYMVDFDKEDVNLNLTYKKYTNVQSNITIKLQEFNIHFPKINNKLLWKDLIDKNKTSLYHIQKIIKKINSIFQQKNINIAYKLKSNILPYYEYRNLYKLNLNPRKNMDFTLIITIWIVLSFFLLEYLLKERKKNEQKK